VAGATFCAWPSVGNAKAATDNKERSSLFMRLQKIENRRIVAFCVWVLRATRRFLRAVTSRQKRDQFICTNYRSALAYRVSYQLATQFTPQTHPPSSWHVAAPLPAPIETTHPLC
jgi:hypothetical protein